MKNLLKLCKNQNLCGLIPGMKRSEVYELPGESDDFLAGRKRKTYKRSTIWVYRKNFQIYFDYNDTVTYINVFYNITELDDIFSIPPELDYLKDVYRKIPSSEACIEFLQKNNISFEKKYDIFLEEGCIDIFISPYLHIIYEDNCKSLNSIRLF